MPRSLTGLPTGKFHGELEFKGRTAASQYMIFAKAGNQSWKATYDLMFD